MGWQSTFSLLPYREPAGSELWWTQVGPCGSSRPWMPPDWPSWEQLLHMPLKKTAVLGITQRINRSLIYKPQMPQNQQKSIHRYAHSTYLISGWTDLDNYWFYIVLLGCSSSSSWCEDATVWAEIPPEQEFTNGATQTAVIIHLPSYSVNMSEQRRDMQMTWSDFSALQGNIASWLGC